MNDSVVVNKRLFITGNPLNIIHNIVSFTPLVWTVLMCLYAAHMRISAGYWPRPMIDSPPKDVLSSILEAVTELLFLSLLMIFPIILVWCGLTAWLWKKYTPAQRLAQTIIFWLGMILAFGLSWLDPYRFVSWWMD